MQCQSYRGAVYIDYNLDQLEYTVGVPLTVLVGVFAIAGLIAAMSKISEDSVFKVLVPIGGIVGSFAFIAFIKWLFQTWGAFIKWFEYC